MWTLVFVVCALLPAVMCKEHLPAHQVSEDEREMIYKIIKRLEENDERSQPSRLRNEENVDTTTRPSSDEYRASESPADTCVSLHNVVTRKQTIIRTDYSIGNGAVFLEEFLHVASSEECAERCCTNSTCDTAVYEHKGDHNCYLFKCQGKCRFDDHSSYTTTQIARLVSHPSLPTVVTDHSEDSLDAALDSLVSDDDDDDMDDEISESKTSPATTTTESSWMSSTTASTTTSTPAINTIVWPHSVRLGGMCHRDLHCKDPEAECNFQQCVCHQGLYPINGVCREQCPLGGYQCQTRVDGRIQCVAEEQRCDSIPQCDDGSDELDCVHTSRESSMDANADDKDKVEDKEQKVEEEEEHPDSAADSSEEDDHRETTSSRDQSEQQKTNSSEEEDSDDNHHTDQDSAQTSAHKTGSGGSAPTTTTTVITTTAVSSADDDGGLMSQVKEVIGAGDLQLPIIALSVGLTFTLILLVFVACRLRRVRRQLRKGRPLHGNEADYLINGMYL